MTELFLVIWIIGGNITCEMNLTDCIQTLPKSDYIVVTSEEELNKVYQEHKEDGVRVFRVDSVNRTVKFKTDKDLDVSTKNKITELEFVEQPCGKWKEKLDFTWTGTHQFEGGFTIDAGAK